jgi:hypothetical protein
VGPGPLLVSVAAGVAALGGHAVSGRAQAVARDTAAPRHLWVRPVASLVAPGTGQLLAGRDRGAVYLVVEAFMVMRFVQLQREGDRQANAFRGLAFAAARRAFTAARRDTVFEYYEQMQRYTASGEFDRDPGPAVVPEGDVATYNGAMWLLARRTFWRDPAVAPDPTSLEYQQALEFYRGHAVGPDFRWSWRDAALEQQVFRETIHKSDAALRGARNQLGLLLANHVASAVDALISSRLAAVTRRPAEFHTTLGRRGAALRVQFGF